MTDKTYHLTQEDLRKLESYSSQFRGGQTSVNSDVSGLKSHIERNTNKPREIEEHRSNLPLPEQPPTASDWQSADGRTVNVGSGGTEGPFSGDNDSSLRGPATAGSSVRQSGEELGRNTEPGKSVGRQGKDDLNDLPRDAYAR